MRGAVPHACGLDELAAGLGTSLERGLTEEAARARLAEAGPNRLPTPVRPAYAAIAARQLADPLVALLVLATAVSALIGERLEAGVIAAIVVLDAALGFFQEAGAERAVLALRRALEPVAQVVRDGRVRSVPVEEVVPGDVVVLHEGDRVPADARVATQGRLDVDESALTGESVPVPKSPEPVAAATPLAERTSLVHAGTAVVAGRGRALVVATGPATEMGRIVQLTGTARPPRTPLQRQLGLLSRAMVAVGLGVTAALTAGMLLRGASLEESFLVGVSVAVAAVPEGLAATVTIALAQGARQMAARGAIVRRLGAVETLGGATVIAADKTGTLTVNRLTVAGVHAEPGRTPRDVLAAGALASTGERGVDGAVRGDPVDAAFLVAVEGDPRREDGLDLVRELPFEPERRRMAMVYERAGRRHVVVKGAPETLLDLSCADAERRAALSRVAAEWAAEGLRVLAVGQRELEAGEEDDEEGLEVLGLVAVSDPLRPGAASSIGRARDAGVEVAILTGDHPLTAAAAGRALGLDGTPLTGADLDELEDEEITATGRSVFARVTPAAKLRLVEALQRTGHVVAVTGDGINDAPALRRADVGVAMGSGTEAAREAADVVLTDDDFATIVAAVAEGRRMVANIRHFVAFLLSANLGEVLLFAVAIVAGLGAPLSVVQVLTVNLLTDGLPAVALARDPAPPGSLAAGPRGHGPLLPRRLRAQLLLLGLAVGAAATAAYVAGRGLRPEAARTMAFATLATAELLLVYSIRSAGEPAWRASRNGWLDAAVLGSLACVVLAVALPALRPVFGTEPLGWAEIVVVAALAVLPAALAEAAKRPRRPRESPAAASAFSRSEVPRSR